MLRNCVYKSCEIQNASSQPHPYGPIQCHLNEESVFWRSYNWLEIGHVPARH
jgi:hypothetical protein